jgi:hypothetical protein
MESGSAGRIRFGTEGYAFVLKWDMLRGKIIGINRKSATMAALFGKKS